MSGDYSRKIFDPRKHYSGVLMQQGRVQLDSDWNEQLAVQLHRTETEAIDTIGRTGVPKKNDGFKIGVASNDLTISAGRIYVDGLLCELEEPATYTEQPYLPNPEFTTPLSSPPSTLSQLNLVDGSYLVYLDAWKREITALDDRLIREVALGGPDTTTRIQNVFQVKLLPFPIASPPDAINCDTALNQFDQLNGLSTGTMNARTQAQASQDNPCLLPPSAGYTRLENQLYRVEIHTGGPRNQATFKWSRDNASVESTIAKIDGNVVTVSDLGKDEVLSFAAGQWVEIVDDESTLKGTPHPLVQIDVISPASLEITMKSSVDAFASLSGLKLRRWDQTGVNATSTGTSVALASWIDLENQIQVRFSNGEFNAGDYWLIPARTATGEIEWPPFEIPNTSPEPQPAKGIHHHYCKLAVIEVEAGVATVKHDCRKPFPALTDICAEDICFDNDNCQLSGAETVQEAIDALCAARDLRFHNKHLHGWGIVCGLQVECGPDPANQSRRHVTVRKGYAIDCNGNDVILQSSDKIDLIDLIEESPMSPPVSENNIPDMEVCLVLNSDPKAKSRYRVEPYPKTNTGFQALLKGTILSDFITDCLKGLIDFITQEFTVKPNEGNVPVGPTQKRVTTFSNLLIELTNKENGPFVFLSGEKGKSDPNFEDTILHTFYDNLRAKLQSHTFCAMFENARQFPDYPFTGLNIATIFSKGFQTRFRVHPNGLIGYSVGASDKINVFDLKKNEMVAELEFPGGSSSIVQDVAFSQDGKQMFAVGTINNKDSMFAVADISGLDHTFRKPTMICDILLMTLATSPSVSTNVYAVGQGKGLYEINPQNVNATPTPSSAFVASGHLVVNDKNGLAYATANGGSGPVTNYDRVRRINLKSMQDVVEFHTVSRNANGINVATPGEDGIAVSQDNSPKLYAVSVLSSTTSTNKQVVVFDGLDKTGNPNAIGVADLGENTAIRMEHNPLTGNLMVTYEDSYRVGLITPNNTLIPNYRQPTQISPLSIASSSVSKQTYVLNYASNTIGVYPTDSFASGKSVPLQPLVDYRADVLNAFADLLGGLLQYLKDCFCDHLLVNCPTCGPDDKLYLACITIKNGQVFKVCNFSLRKYVHSFPTVEYWLSIVPIIPMIKMAFEKFCCSVLPGFFGKFNAPRPTVPDTATPGNNFLKSSQIRTGVTFVQQTDFRAGVTDLGSRFSPAKTLLGDFATGTAKTSLTQQPAAVAHTDVVGQPADEAKQKLINAGILVDKVEQYDPNKGASNLASFATAPVQLNQGTKVNLVERDGKILFFTRAEDPHPSVDDLRIQVDNVVKTVNDNSAAVTANKSEVDKILPQLQELSQKVDSTKATFDQTAPQIQTLQAQFVKANDSITQATTQIQALNAQIAANATDLQASKASIANALNLQTELANVKAQLLQTQQAHAQDLAARDKQIADLKTTLTGFQTSIAQVKTLQTQIDKLTVLKPTPSGAPVAKEPVKKKKDKPEE